MPLSRAHLIQSLSLLLVQGVALIFLTRSFPGISIDSIWSSIAVVIVISLVQSIAWWFFVEFFARLPILLYPVLTFFLTGFGIYYAGNFVPGVTITGIFPAIGISLILTVINAVLGALFSLDEDESFDKNVTRKMVAKYGHPKKTDIPGVIFLEIDGLCIDFLKSALDEGLMPNLKSWLDSGSHKLMTWETDFSSQTGAMQAGILLGSNKEIPAYRWWDRKKQKIVMSGNPFDAESIEASVSSGKGLLSVGGASRGNMFSGDAVESLFTISSLLNKKRERGPGFYAFLFNPYVVARLISRFIIEVIKEWYEAYAQKVRKDKYIVSSRTPAYAFLRAFMGPFIQDLTTYAVIGDIMRGVPAVYALYAGYDDIGHFAGPKSPEGLEALKETDRYFKRISQAVKYAPRPYKIVVLSDHGQSQGPTFDKANGVSLQKLVSSLISGEVYASLNTNEAWDNLNAVLSESTRGNTKSAKLAKKTLLSKIKDGVVQVGPDRDHKDLKIDKKLAEEANVVIFGSGSAGLIYIKNSPTRLTYEELNERYPNLIPGLVAHPGIGLVIVKSKKSKTMVIGKTGVNFVDTGKIKGKDPLKVYSKNAKKQISVESSFTNCPDILVTTTYDPKTEELASFENQIGHHGGLGGPQNRPFVVYPTELNYDGKEINSASELSKLLKSWCVRKI